LLNGIAGILGILEDDNTGALGSAIRTNVNICTDDAAYTS
jgi:hypothetical protein